MMEHRDVAVVGGGLAGLVAAVVAARAGARVTMFDARSEPGGRARTHEQAGFLRNEGPRGFYVAGQAMKILIALGITPAGGTPVLAGVALRSDGSSGELPFGAAALARTKLLGTRAKAELVGAMGRMAVGGTAGQRDRSFADWLDQHTSTLEVRQVLEMFVRLGTYAADLDALSAEAALDQGRIGTRGVVYLHGGWRQLVRALMTMATSEGVEIVSGTSIRSVEPVGDGSWTLTGHGTSLQASRVIVAGLSPSQVHALVGDASDEVAGWAQRAHPAMAACLDVCLERIPVPERSFDLGLDRPLYLSFHTPAAQLTPATGGAVVHVMKYVPSGELDRSPVEDRAELEQMLDRMQPGWRDSLVDARYLHRMAASHHVPEPGVSTAGRPAGIVGDAPGLLVAGDWVGPHGLLADAAVASGAFAGSHVAADLARA